MARKKKYRPSAPGGPVRLAPAREPPAIRVNAVRLVRFIVIFCVCAEVLFVFLDATVNYARTTEFGMVRRLCNIAREDSLASWFGTTQTFLVGLTLGLICLVTRRDGRSRWAVAGWLLLACFFLYMSADDGAEIHERLGSAFKKAHAPAPADPNPASWQADALQMFPSYTWQILFMPVFMAMGLFIVVFLWRELEHPSARWWVAIALGCFSLGVVLDFIEGLEPEHPLNLYTWIQERFDLQQFTVETFLRSPYDAARHFSKSIEEFLEMLGTTILWGIFLSHFTHVGRDFRIQFTRPAPDTAA